MTSDQDNTETEKINLFWTLFIIDKQISLACGRSCHLHSFDCNVPLPDLDDSALREQRVATIGLAFLCEGIYRDLYSAKSIRASKAQRERKAEALMQKLNDWVASNQHLWSSLVAQSTQKMCSGKELHYAMLTYKLLIMRRSKSQGDAAQLKSHARDALIILKDAFEASGTIATNAVLQR